MFYSIPVLEGILGNQYLKNLKYLSGALWLLLKKDIEAVDLSLARRWMSKFSLGFEELYGGIRLHACIYRCMCN